MADAKIINYGQPIGAGTTVISDNTSEALDIEAVNADGSTDDYIVVDTTDTSESVTIKASNHGVKVTDSGAFLSTKSQCWSLLAEDASATNPNILPVSGDGDTGIGRAEADALSLIAGGQEGIRITEASDATTTQINGKALIKGDVSDELTGTVSIDSGALNTLIGDGTAFTTELFDGAAVKINGQTFHILSIASNTSAVLDSNASGAVSAGTKIYTDNAPLFKVESGDSRSIVEVNNHFMRISGRGGPSSTVPSHDDVCLYIDGNNSPAGHTYSTSVQINAQGPSGPQILMGSDGNTTGRIMTQSSVLYVGTNSTNQDVVFFPGSQKIMSVRGDERCAVLQDSDIKLYQNEASAAGQEITFYKSRNTTDESAATIVNDDDILGEIKFKGANGDAFSDGARIFARVNGSPSDNDMPTELVFATSADGSETPSEQMHIDSAGDIKIVDGNALDFYSSGETAGGSVRLSLYGAGSAATIRTEASTTDLVLGTNSTERLRIKADTGRVGIFEDAPECALHIKGGESGLSSLRGGTNLLLEDSDENGIFLRSIASKEQHVYFANSSENANAGMQFQGNANRLNLLANAVTIASLHNGNFGVGTTTPTTKFEVNGAGAMIGALGTALTNSGGTASVSTSGSSTTLTGVNTVFHDDFHVGAAIKVGTVTTTVTAIANATSLTLEDAINTGSTGTACTRDGGELFAVKTGDNKTLFSVTGTGAIQAGSAAADSDANNNLAIGDSDALDNINQMSLGERNYIIGHSSGQYSLSTGQRNCFMGYAAGEDINSGFDNVLLGAYAGSAGTSMQGATHLGYSAGASATGNDTVFIGREAGLDSTGNYNTSVGSFSLASEGSATSASYITALGYKTLTKNPGGYNTAIGAHSLEDVIAGGTHNTAVGYTTGNDVTDNTNMVLLGSGAQPSANTGVTNEIVIGKGAAGQGSNTIMLGDSNITGLHCYDTSISSPSDSRIKDNVQDSGLGLDFINALRPVKYQKKHPSEFPEEIREKCWADQEVVRTRPSLDPDTGEEGIEEYTETIPADTKPDDWQARTEYGLIAQEVKAAMVAHGAEDWQGHKVLPSGMEALSYGNLVTVLVKSVQELSARVAELEGN